MIATHHLWHLAGVWTYLYVHRLVLVDCHHHSPLSFTREYGASVQFAKQHILMNIHTYVRAWAHAYKFNSIAGEKRKNRNWACVNMCMKVLLEQITEFFSMKKRRSFHFNEYYFSISKSSRLRLLKRVSERQTPFPYHRTIRYFGLSLTHNWRARELVVRKRMCTAVYVGCFYLSVCVKKGW